MAFVKIHKGHCYLLILLWLLSACEKGILGLAPFPKREMLTSTDGCNTEANNYTDLETAHLAAAMFSSWQCSRLLCRQAKRNVLNPKSALVSQ